MNARNRSSCGHAEPEATAVGHARFPGKARAVVDGFIANDLLTFASAISFQILSSLVPLLLFAFGMLGFVQLEHVWRDQLSPDLEATVSQSAFAFIDDTVEMTLQSKQLFWVTAGFLIALWETSGAVRAVMGALNRVYGGRTQRSWTRRMLVSLTLALAVGTFWLAAIAVVVLGTLLYGDVGQPLGALLFVVRWTAAGMLLLAAIALLLHVAPERNRPLHRVTLGSLLILGGWIAMSIAFGVYLRDIADYNSVFGGLATVVVLIAYLYAAAVIFLGGVQVDALGHRASPEDRGLTHS